MAQGTYQTLLDKGIDFVSLMESSESSNDVSRRVSVGKVDVEVGILVSTVYVLVYICIHSLDNIYLIHVYFADCIGTL